MTLRALFQTVVTLASLFAYSHNLLADPPAGYPFLPFEEAVHKAQRENKKIFLYYGRLGCGFCDKTNKESFSDPKLKSIYTAHYVLTYVDAESGHRITLPSGERMTEMEFGARLKALVTPVFIFLESDGTPIVRIPGFQTTADFIRYDQYVQQGHYKTESLTDFLARNPS